MTSDLRFKLHLYPTDLHSFHPMDPPQGMQCYDIGALTWETKKNLNEMKMKTRRRNQIYLRSHPEIKGLITILFRNMLLKQPLIEITEVMGEFFNRPRREIITDLLHYLLSLEDVDEARSKIISAIQRELERPVIPEFPDVKIRREVSVSTELTDWDEGECVETDMRCICNTPYNSLDDLTQSN